jgi:precorrin-2 dehydrogenase/sirohydrochlorin ferrochelatase
MENLNPYYPVFLDLRGRRVVVVGGGLVAARKIDGLLKSACHIKVIAPDIRPELASLPLEFVRRDYAAGDLNGASLAFAATDDAELNALIARDAAAAGILCNAASAPETGDFIVPALFERGPIKIAISTGGASPALAKRLRFELGCQIGREYEQLALILNRIRPLVLAQPGGSAAHQRVFELLVGSELIEALHAGELAEAEAIVAMVLGESLDLGDIL